ncbi:MAG: NCS1 family nucleobase:cation symporter-1 [Myxococcales bacterium]|nr:NCS1 family nucleobase:cation symporter-1 [Myxococcales bacterium]
MSAHEVVDPDPGLYSDDIRPTTAAERHWSVLNMASLWIGMVVCVPTYTLAASLIKEGMSWWQAVMTIMLGNVIVLVPMVLGGHAGTKYGVPFPVLARASFGVKGAHIPSLLRALVACGWFGIQTWFGGFAIYQLVNALTGDALVGADLPVLGIDPGEITCFVVFWLLQIVIIHRGVESIRLLETAAAPFLIAIGLLLLGWAYAEAGGLGAMLSNRGQFGPGGAREGEFLSVFVPSLTAMVGFWATLSLNIPDFTRYAKTQRDQVLGQALGLPTTMTLFAFISVAVTAATTVIFADPETGAPGEPIWDPTVLAGRIGGGFTVVLSLLALAVATLSTNIAANVVSPANAMINAAPERVSFRVGGFVTAGLGLVIFPWKLIETTGGYIFTWLVGYSALLGPIGGILLADYFLLRRTELHLTDLYRHGGRYAYRGGFNPAAILAFAVAVLPNVPGFLHQAGAIGDGVLPAWLDDVYTYAWFVGFILAGALYLGLMRVLYPESGPATPTPPEAASSVKEAA